MRKEIEGLKDCSNGAAMFEEGSLFEHDPLAIDLDLTRIREFQAGNDSQQSGFSSAGWADEHERMDLFQFQGNTVEHRVTIETLRNLMEAKLHALLFLLSNARAFQPIQGLVRLAVRNE